MTTPTREHVLEAAARLYAEHGFRGTTTRRIAEEAGVNEVTLFRKFGSKTALLLEALRSHEMFKSGANALPADPADPLAELTAFATGMRKALHATRSTIRKAMAEFEERPDMPRCMTHAAAAIHASVQQYFETLGKLGYIKDTKSIPAAKAMLMSAIFHDALHRDIDPHSFPQPAASAPATYARLCLQSLGFQPVAARRPRAARSKAS